MKNESPAVNLNSPVVQRMAAECGMPVAEYVEFAVLLNINTIRTLGGIDKLMPDTTPAALLKTLRGAAELAARINKLPPFEQQRYLDMPEFRYLDLFRDNNNNEE